MDKPQWSPTVVVGIDFGMTCTGVAYSSEETGWARPEVIQRWPDRRGSLFNKYPSRVGYNETGQAVDWGPCNMSTEVVSLEREFKLYLDPSFRDGSEQGLSHNDAVKHYMAYMKALNKHLDETMMQRFFRWGEQDVEYRFSIPTTWKSPRLTGQLKAWLAEAGFVNTLKQRVVFSRTEAEAAAVYVAKQYQKGDVVMVVDAGGATTDLNILEVTEKTPEVTQMLALDKAEGINIGSVLIDTEARRMIEQKLRAMHVYADTELKWVAEGMMERSGFEYFKCNYDGDAIVDHYMEVPRRPGQHVILKSSELRDIFDILVGDLISTIGDKISSLVSSHPQQRLRYIVLSGGLGSSKYVKQRLEAKFCTGSPRPMTATQLQVLVAAEPQLAVVKGLVMDRSQILDQGVSIYMGRCCRVSYGILGRHPYDNKKHFGEPTVKDRLTGILWVEDQIDWLIKEGEVVPEEGVTKRCTLRIAKDKRFEPFLAHIVMSELPASALPQSKIRGPVTRLCTVTGNFLPGDFTSENFTNVKKSMFGKQKEHDIAHFNLKVIVGSTDLEFEFVSLDGRSRYTENSSRVKVIWHDVRPRLPQTNDYSKIFPPSLHG